MLLVFAGGGEGSGLGEEVRLHIVHGDPDGDKPHIERLAATGAATRRANWVAPKQAKTGDEVVFYVGGYGFFATGTVLSDAAPRRDWAKRYGVRVGKVRLIDPPISLAAIRRQLPQLSWANYPRSITTPPSEVAEEVSELIARRRRTGLPEEIDSAALEEASIHELRKVAVLGAKAQIVGSRRTVTKRTASRAIRLYVLRRANGRCEGCGEAAPFVCPDGSQYLETHHTHLLSDGGPDHPAAVIALCPNCHRRAHHATDGRRYNDHLIAKLRRMELGRRCRR
ncbi:MAG: HNH endonuclease [Acidobacteria bacterium]|nr:HNH endonuclease [Acidobacteriota bacterium]